jgi:hypothetical protein
LSLLYEIRDAQSDDENKINDAAKVANKIYGGKSYDGCR